MKKEIIANSSGRQLHQNSTESMMEMQIYGAFF